ncbi:hypothetical protein L345_03127, partial [Ophiophagus hannah]
MWEFVLSVKYSHPQVSPRGSRTAQQMRRDGCLGFFCTRRRRRQVSAGTPQLGWFRAAGIAGLQVRAGQAKGRRGRAAPHARLKREGSRRLRGKDGKDSSKASEEAGGVFP